MLKCGLVFIKACEECVKRDNLTNLFYENLLEFVKNMKRDNLIEFLLVSIMLVEYLVFSSLNGCWL